jgi:hypothetical protein
MVLKREEAKGDIGTGQRERARQRGERNIQRKKTKEKEGGQ